MTNQIPMRGNICSCGGVWFCHDLPESDPDKCPYCKRQIDSGEIFEDSDIKEQDEQGQLPDNIKDGLSKATGQETVKLVTKACDFCTNELFFDEEDANKANHCPYCDGHLLNAEEYQAFLGGGQQDPNMLLGVDVNELEGQLVYVKFRSLIPWKKPLLYVFGGVDPMTMKVKLIGLLQEITWVDFSDIKSVTVSA